MDVPGECCRQWTCEEPRTSSAATSGGGIRPRHIPPGTDADLPYPQPPHQPAALTKYGTKMFLKYILSQGQFYVFLYFLLIKRTF